MNILKNASRFLNCKLFSTTYKVQLSVRSFQFSTISSFPRICVKHFYAPPPSISVFARYLSSSNDPRDDYRHLDRQEFLTLTYEMKSLRNLIELYHSQSLQFENEVSRLQATDRLTDGLLNSHKYGLDRKEIEACWAILVKISDDRPPSLASRHASDALTYLRYQYPDLWAARFLNV